MSKRELSQTHGRLVNLRDRLPPRGGFEEWSGVKWNYMFALLVPISLQLNVGTLLPDSCVSGILVGVRTTCRAYPALGWA